MNPMPWVLDRIEQTFKIFKDGVLFLIIPLFIYNFLSFFIWIVIFLYIFFWWYFDFILSNPDYSAISSYLSSPKFIFLIALFSFLFLLYSLLYIPFYIYTIKTIKNLYNWENIDIKSNFKYWISNFLTIMKTYWFVFSYVALLPALIFILWWWIFNISYFLWLWEDIQKIWMFTMIFWSIFFLIFLIYRGLKVKFSIISAVDNDNYTKENFNHSINKTDDNWWRILWNLLIIWIIISFVTWTLSQIFWLLFWQSLDFWNLSQFWPENIKNLISSFSVLNYVISSFFDLVINTSGTIFIIVFTYVFHKRLSIEMDSLDKVDNKKEEL